MGLRLILGRAGRGKGRLCRQEIIAETAKNPAGFPLFYIVPEQATFQAEYALFAASGLGGSMRAQVLSFRRLAWKVLQEVGGGRRLFIDDLGKSMVLRKVLEKRRSELRVFKHAGAQGGVLENLVELANEFKRAGITVAQFEQIYEQHLKPGGDLPVLFKEKMGDLLLILMTAAAELGDRYLDAEDYLDLLASQAAHSSFLKGAVFWIDGFERFTNQEYAVLATLLKLSRKVTVTLCLDREILPGEQLDELDLFYPAALTYRQLLQQARDGCFPVEKILLQKSQKSRFGGRPELEHLEQRIFRYPIRPYREKPAALYLAAAPNRRCEVESLARELIRRVRDEGCRWRDLAVLTSSLDDYREIIATTFGDYDLPFFLDQKRAVTHHPLAEFIRAALEIVNHNWRYSAVFRCFKTEFLFPLAEDKTVRQKWRERTDRLENYVLAFGIQGGLWRQADPWGFLAGDTLDAWEGQTGEGPLTPQGQAVQNGVEENSRAGGELPTGETAGGDVQDLSADAEQATKGASTGETTGADKHGSCADADRTPGGLSSKEAAGGDLPALTGDTIGKEKELSPGETAFLQLLHSTRQRLGGPLLRLEKKLKAAQTVREKTLALYALLTESHVWERLELWSSQALERGNPERAREHQQVYKGVIDLFDQLVEIMGEEKISGALYARLVETGLESLRLGLVPPSLDQVFVGDLERSRPGAVKFAYLLGANDGLLPAPPREDGIFSDEERGIADSWGLELAAGGRRRLLDGQFIIYTALTRATDGLWVSYPLADEEGRALLPALLIVHLKELFPSLPVGQLEMEPCSGDVGVNKETGTADPEHDAGHVEPGHDLENVGPEHDAGHENDAERALEHEAAALLSYVAHPRRTLSHLAVQLSRWRKGAALHPFWWDLYNWFAAAESWRSEALQLLSGVFYRNREEPLQAATSRQLYGLQLLAGVSRLEMFRACPFAHFVTYGLHLRERPLYSLEAPDIGRFFHAVLRNFTLSLQEKGLIWGALGKDECLQLVAAEVDRLVPKLQQEILFSSGRYRYLAGKLKDTVGEAALILGEQDRHSSFRPVGVELSFGRGGTLPGVMLELGGGWLELLGRIDRVDLAIDQEGRAYLRVLDYKAGPAKFNLAKVYHGLALQLFTYLDIVLQHAPEWLQVEALPGGVLYFRVHAPLIRAPGLLLPEEVEKEIRKRYKMQGLILHDKEVALLMDGALQKGHSDLIPVGLTREGRFYRNSATFDAGQYARLRAYLRRLIEATAEGIAGGEVAIAPYRLGKEKACTFCPHRPVCQFDPALAENDYRLLRNESAETIWTELEKRFYGEETEGNSQE